MLKVLIVEDEYIIREGLVHTLDWAGMGCTVVDAAENGVDGYAKILLHKPDIVIADVQMPKQNGLIMVEQALKMHSFYSVFLSSYSEFEYAKKAIELGAARYLLKPLDEKELAAIILEISQKIKKQQYYKSLEQNQKLDKHSNWNNWSIEGLAKSVYVLKSIDYIKNNYNKEPKITKIADILGISTSYLSRKFKEELGYCFVDVLNMYRIHLSIVMINDGFMKMYQISENLGFADYKHFCSVFKKYMGVSPKKYFNKER